MEQFISEIPKAELHLHIEGTLEPELMFKLAKRNNIKLKYKSVDEVRKAYIFHNLQSFLDIYYEAASVLITEQDFYDLTLAYLQKAASQNVKHAEIFFDPETHTARGIEFATVINGIIRAFGEGKKQLGISAKLIMCFLRHLSEEEAFITLEQALPFKGKIIAVGLDSGERGNPPSKFERVFAKARENGFLVVAHAGEEGTTDYIWQALDLLKAKRIDHGDVCLQDPALLKRLKDEQIPLTMCPLSNLALHVIDKIKHHPIKQLLDLGLCVTVNSDDPAYFNGYINENYLAIAKAFNLSKQEIKQLAKNSFQASFLDENEKQAHIKKII